MGDPPNTIRRVNGYGKDAYTYIPVLIIGAGESGIALGSRLKQALGFDQFRIYERQSGAGGTWWSNRYPGVACDIPAVFYSFSFSPNHKWTSLHPSGEEILDYLYEVCEKFQITDKIQYNTDVSEVRWLEHERLWQVKLVHLVPGTGDLSRQARGNLVNSKGKDSVYLAEETVRAKIVCPCAGGFAEPNSWPKGVPGHQQFEGPIMHSARWDASISLKDKNVIVVGSGCSAAQIVPELIKSPYNAKSVTQIMRSPPWVVPRLPTPFGAEKWKKWSPVVFTYFPLLARLLRTMIFALGEWHFFSLFKMNSFAKGGRRRYEAGLLKHMKKTAPEKYHEILQPNYGVGCKRRVFDAKWLSGLHDPNIELTTRPLTAIHPRSVTIGPGRNYPDPKDKNSKAPTEQCELPADAIILANGFDVSNWLFPLNVIGKNEANMHKVWEERGGPQAYMGLAMDGFPNLFIIFGPNTATGHSSVILASENMVEYTIKFIKQILRDEVRIFEVKKEKEIAWTEEIQKESKSTVFLGGGCTSWYKTLDGWNSTSYTRSQIDFTIRCMFPKWDHWNIEYTRKGLIKVQVRRVLTIAFLILLIFGIYSSRGDVAGSLIVWQRRIRDYLNQATLNISKRLVQYLSG